jgi:hypothetical protein
MAEPNDRLRAARERTESPQTPGEPLSRAELAELVKAWLFDRATPPRVILMGANYLGKLERGLIRWPQADYRAGLRSVLGARTDAELGFRRPRRSAATVAPVNRNEFLRVALGTATGIMARPLTELVSPTEPTPVPSVVGRREIDQVQTVAHVFGMWDHTYGGGLVREAVAAQLRHSAELLNARCPQRWRGDLVGAVGFLAHTSGFMAFDAHAHEDALRMFRFALACAEDAGNWHLRAKVLSSMARQAIWRGDPDGGLTLVELAMVRADRLTPTERAMLLSARARALAKLARVQDTTSAIGLADDEFSRSAPSEDPLWMSYYDRAQHAGDTGHALFDLALTGHFVSEASTRLAAAVADHTDTYARSRAISATKLASLTMRTGDPCEAAVQGIRALADVDSVRSRRAADDLHELRGFAAPHDRITEVAELRSRIGAVVGAW